MVVANGEKIRCDKVYARLDWKMQGVKFKAYLMVLPLEGCQMVLGIQWLILLGSILWNFNELRMEFKVNNKKMVLRGFLQPRLQMMHCKALMKLLKLSTRMCKAQLCSMMVMKEGTDAKEGNDNKHEKLSQECQA